jgi:hypothetical protein
MFTHDSIIDVVQNSKKVLVNSFVTDETIKSATLKTIDAEAEFLRQMGKLSLDTATLVATEAQKVGSHLTKEMSKVDFSKFNDLVKTAVKPNQSAE